MRGGGAGTKFLYPFFVSVYLMRIHKVDLAEKVYRYKVIICIAFIVLLGLYQFDTYIYVSGFDIYGNFYHGCSILDMIYSDTGSVVRDRQ